MMRQDEPPVRTIVLIMINLPVRGRMILQIGMEGRNFRHLLQRYWYLRDRGSRSLELVVVAVIVATPVSAARGTAGDTCV